VPSDPGKGQKLLTFHEDPEHALAMNRISTIMPPHNPFVLNWHRAAGRIGSFEVHPHFFEEALGRARLAPSRFSSMPTRCFRQLAKALVGRGGGGMRFFRSRPFGRGISAVRTARVPGSSQRKQE